MKEVTASREAYDYRRRGQTCKAPGNNSILPHYEPASVPLTVVCFSFSFSFSPSSSSSAVFLLPGTSRTRSRACFRFWKRQVIARDGCVTRTRPSLIGAPEGFIVFVSVSLSRFSFLWPLSSVVACCTLPDSQLFHCAFSS